MNARTTTQAYFERETGTVTYVVSDDVRDMRQSSTRCLTMISSRVIRAPLHASSMAAKA
jgi:hypothetical protein